MKAFVYLLPFAIGCVIPLQAALNNSLKAAVQSGALFASFVQFVVGTLALAVVCVANGEKWASVTRLSDAAWWQFGGGLIGALFVFGSTFLVPRIGVANTLNFMIAGQVIAALAFDQAGILGLTVRVVDTPRIIGAVLVIAGVILINHGGRGP